MSDSAALEAWLQAGAGSGEAACAVHETPIAKVFVFSGRVLKLKKPVDFGFLDFTSRDKRAWAIRRELDFNRRTAPDVYRQVHAVMAEPGGFCLVEDDEAAEQAVDFVLEMRPFETSHILANHPQRIDGELAERLGREVARVQAAAPQASKDRGAAALDYVLRSNAEQLRSLRDRLGREAAERLIGDTRAAFDQLAPLLDARRDAGFVRRCHGDLHLGNIVVEDGRPILFDCIEFNDVLSEIDVGYDIAFLLMDLAVQDRPQAANRVLNAWLDEAARSLPLARLEGLRALPLFQSVRAAVRTHVCAHGGEHDAAQRYLRAAQDHLHRPAPRLVAVGGLSGSGKSTFARALAPSLGASPGAAVLRSDEIRKRLFDAAPTDRLDRSAYTPEVSQQVYALMLQEAQAALAGGMSVVLDAAFLQLHERESAESLGAAVSAPFHGFWMQAPQQVLRERLRARTGDASDADEAVLERQLTEDVGELRWRQVDAAAPTRDQLADCGLT